jgi:hypothetical protein
MDARRSLKWFALFLALLVAGLMLWRDSNSPDHTRGTDTYDGVGRSPALAADAADSAAQGLGELSRILVSIPEGDDGARNHQNQPADTQWANSPIVKENAMQALAAMRDSGNVHFRSTYFNPRDTYIDANIRATFSDAFANAVKRVKQLKDTQRAIGREQMAALYESGMLEQTTSGTWQLKGREHGTPKDGWYTHVDGSGRQYEIRWSDLDWTAQTAALADYLREQLDVSIVEFFFRAGTITAADRDLLMMYAIGDGPARLQQMAADSRDEFLRIRSALYRQ